MRRRGSAAQPSPGDVVAGNPSPAEDVALDFLAELLAALEARGLDYRVAGRVRNFDLEAPMVTPAGRLDDIRLTDHDVVLARADVPAVDAGSSNYGATVPVELAGLELPLLRGWTVVAAIRVRFRRLEEPAREVLAAASVLDDRAGIDELARATGLEEDALARALDELEWERWLASDPRGYTFVARIVRRVIARDMLTAGRRRRLRAAAAPD